MTLCALRIGAALAVFCIVGVVGVVELCPEYASFLRANDLRCQQPPLACTSNAECRFEPSDECYVQRCDGGFCSFYYNATCQSATSLSTTTTAASSSRLNAQSFRVLSVNNTAQCHGFNTVDQYCFTGLCDGGQCRELLGKPVANVFPCDCAAERYLECRTDEHCLPLVAELPADRQACADAHCSLSGFCELRQPLPPVPDGCCSVDADCNDGNQCTADKCNAATGVCSYSAAVDVVGCCAATLDCQGPPANRPLCPSAVCDAGACLLTPTAPLCVGQQETCQGERFSYCAVETSVVPGLTGVLMCAGSAELVLDRSCVMKYNNGRDCSYGTCVNDPLDNGLFARCRPLPALNSTLFACGCACGERPVEQLVCGAANTEFAYQCVPIGQGNNNGGGGGGGGGAGGPGTDSADRESMLWFVFALIALSSAVAIGTVLFLFARLMWRRRQRNKKRAQSQL